MGTLEGTLEGPLKQGGALAWRSESFLGSRAGSRAASKAQWGPEVQTQVACDQRERERNVVTHRCWGAGSRDGDPGKTGQRGCWGGAGHWVSRAGVCVGWGREGHGHLLTFVSVGEWAPGWRERRHVIRWGDGAEPELWLEAQFSHP